MNHHTNTSLKRNSARVQRRSAFTLVEMIIVVMVIAILAALALPVFNAAAQQAKVHRTRAIVAKLDQIIGEKYESYRTRAVPVRVPVTLPPNQAAGFRLLAMHELMRFEMPDRITDVTAGPAYGVPPDVIPQTGYPVYNLAALNARPALNRQYLRRAFEAHAPGQPALTGLQYWTGANENAECLYLILATTRDGDHNALDWFSKTEIGDTDDDGMNEILDAWGQPIVFLRWAPGYRNDAAPYPVTPQQGDIPDPFDPFMADPRWQVAGSQPFALKPLLVSGGSNKKVNISVNTPPDPNNPGSFLPYAMSSPANDPYWPQAVMIGFPFSADASDNITNHDLEAK